MRNKDLLWPPLIWRPKDPEMRRVWGQLRMNTLNVWMLISLGLTLVTLWTGITIYRHGGVVDTLSLVLVAISIAGQALPVYGIVRWRNHARRILDQQPRG